MSSIKLISFKIFAATTLILQLVYANKLHENFQHSLNQDIKKKLIFKKFVQQIETEENYKTCIIFGKSMQQYPLEEILQEHMKKMLVLQEDFKSLSKCCGYHTKFLGIMQWQEEIPKDLLKSLAETLDFKRHNKLVVIKNGLESQVKISVVKKFFDLCKFYKIPNLVLIFKDFYETQNVYQFQIFPNLTVKKLNLSNSLLVIYPNKVKNLNGTGIRTMPDQVLPRTAISIDDQGRLQVKGYVMKFLHLFSRYLNATLQFPLNVTTGKILLQGDMYNLTQQELIDIPASLSTYVLPNSSLIMSNSYEINKWCIIVPIEPPLPFQVYLDKHINRNFFYLFFIGRVIFSIILVLSTKVWSLKNKIPFVIRINDILVNSNVVSGMFGGSFKLLPDPSKSMRFIYLSIFLSGLVHYILVSTRIQAFLTHPFSYRIQTLSDIPTYNLRILIAPEDYQFMLHYLKFSPEFLSLIFKIAEDYEEFSQIRSTLNALYAYPISSSLWFMYDALQTYTNRPIFCLTPICFPYTGIMAFILPSNSLFMEPLNRLIKRVRDMGLLEFWLKTSFIDLVKIKKIYLPKDRAPVEKSSMLGTEDFRYMWIIMLGSFMLAFIVFLGEILWYRCRSKRDK